LFQPTTELYVRRGIGLYGLGISISCDPKVLNARVGSHLVLGWSSVWRRKELASINAYASSKDIQEGQPYAAPLAGVATLLSKDDTSAESGPGFFPVSGHFPCSKMTLSSLFLRLFIWGRAVVRTGGCLCGLEAESGAHPPHFLFARGSRGGRLRVLGLSGPPVVYSVVKLARDGVWRCGEHKQNIRQNQGRRVRRFWRLDGGEGDKARCSCGPLASLVKAGNTAPFHESA
jgi:hypothetical protein